MKPRARLRTSTTDRGDQWWHCRLEDRTGWWIEFLRPTANEALGSAYLRWSDKEGAMRLEEHHAAELALSGPVSRYEQFGLGEEPISPGMRSATSRVVD